VQPKGTFTSRASALMTCSCSGDCSNPSSPALETQRGDIAGYVNIASLAGYKSEKSCRLGINRNGGYSTIRG
jgi:hypothetical protein